MTTNTNLSTINSWLNQTSIKLQKAGITTGRLDSLVLLSDMLGNDKSYLLAHPDEKITKKIQLKLNSMIKRRINHEPLAYIRGKSEFYGHEFLVNKHTLVPRPETETMIDLFTKIYNSQKSPLQKVRPFTERKNVNWSMVDVGTGSGSIAISLKLAHPDMSVVATDISDECIKIARENSIKYDTKIKFIQGNLIEPVLAISSFTPTAITANLPYVPDNFSINLAATREPRIAIFGGKDGLSIYRELFNQLNGVESSKITSIHKPRYVFTEAFPEQHTELENIAQSSGYKLIDSEDFIQVFEIS